MFQRVMAASMRRAVTIARPTLPAAAPASSSLFGLAAPSLAASAVLPRRTLHSSSCLCGGHGGDAGEFTHGTDFLPRAGVERRVKMILQDVDKIDKQKLEDPNSTFRELGLDSLDEVEVVMMLEEEFVIDIQDEVASTLLSPLDAINYICQHPFAHPDHADDPHHEHH